MGDIGFGIKYTFQGSEYTVEASQPDPEVKEIAKRIQTTTGLSNATLKLLGPGLKGALVLADNEGKKASEAGIIGCRGFVRTIRVLMCTQRMVNMM